MTLLFMPHPQFFQPLALNKMNISTPVGNFYTNDGNFLGIRYATGNRFEAPTSYSYPRSTYENDFGSSCPQICRELPSFCPYEISEDCLFLNIFVPKLMLPNFNTRLPVFMFIHGGSFETGSGSLKVLNGTFLANELQAIVVTFNYRLNIFGFTLENYGFKDQQMAIQWVHDYIQYFGGDGTKITLSGQSAGALSVVLHASTFPQNQLISGAMVMSMPALPFRSIDKARNEIKLLNIAIGCGDTVTLDCIKSKSMRELLNAKKNLKKDSISLSLQMTPVLDGVDIIDHPLNLVDNINIPMIVGSVSNETSYSIEKLLPIEIGIDSSTLVFKGLFGEKISRDLRLKEEFVGRNGLVRAMSDTMFSCPHLKSLQSANKYGYYWEVPFSGSDFDSQGGICGSNACHSIDIAFLFNEPGDIKEREVGAKFRMYVREFVHNGRPGRIQTVDWAPSAQSILSFTTNYSLTILNQHPRLVECEFWNKNIDFVNPKLNSQPQSNISFLIIVPLILVLLVIINLQNWLFLYTNYLRIQFKRPRSKVTVNGEEKMRLLTASMGLSPNPVDIIVEGLSFHRNGMNLLLNCSCKFRAGTMTAVIGPSGSGKTTLLSLVLIIDRFRDRLMTDIQKDSSNSIILRLQLWIHK